MSRLLFDALFEARTEDDKSAETLPLQLPPRSPRDEPDVPFRSFH
jgi:hypothetical protein